ncbi:MAG: hypothetical protein ACE5RI_01275 [Candidatus Nitrosomaritimum yanchengensis]|uniref:Uncharacterized protein n=1 Tax=Candidatus Nitrosopumilus sediminis TaxID=1229909 RepID=K0BBR6_9ARCH|nr:hypothetical protein [Candidatus Nitrosopumilus sediminis]AFS82572.1 hypothetical protein NSED_03830 [Candidatus Nitrosopumilus sediminis]
MKTRYKIPIIIALVFVAIVPQTPHIIWSVCEILPDCGNDLSYVSGINFFGMPVDTNLFDDHQEKPLGFFLLGVSFTSIGTLVLWGIRK